MNEIMLFIISIFVLSSIYALLALGLNLEFGVAGLLNLGLVAYFAIGAYAYVILSSNSTNIPGVGLPIGLAFILSGVMAAIFARVIGFLTIKFSGEYLLLITLALAEVIRGVLSNEAWLTGGVKGIVGIPKPLLEHFSWHGYQYFFAIMLAVILFAIFIFVSRINEAPLGRTLRAIRDNENLALVAGKNTQKFKVLAHVISAFIYGLAGPIYIWYTTMIVPDMFTSSITFTAWVALVIGGIGSNLGAVLGAFFLMAVLELTRLFNFSPSHALIVAGIREIMLGLILLSVVRWMPEGIFVKIFRKGRAKPIQGVTHNG